MARFDVRLLRNAKTHLVLDVQADYLSGLLTRAVIPFLPARRVNTPITDLNPIFAIGGVDYVLLTQEIAAVARSRLGETITSLADHHNRIIRALDILFTGI